MGKYIEEKEDERKDTIKRVRVLKFVFCPYRLQSHNHRPQKQKQMEYISSIM